MKKSFKMNGLLVLGALWLGCTLPLCATTIFDNTVHDLTNRFNPGTLQVGDEILLASTERYLTNFSFEFWGTNTASPGNLSFAGAVQARVQFYRNDGSPYNGYPTPGSMFYDSGFFSLAGVGAGLPAARRTLIFTAGVGLDFPNGGLFIPTSDITWSITFTNLGATDSLGVDLYSPPVVGSDFSDYWQNNVVGGWTLLTNTVPMNFAARFQASATIPEPSALALLLAGGLGILTQVRRQRRTN